MTDTPENTPNQSCPTSDDPNSWLSRVLLLFERSVLACSQIVVFCKEHKSTEHFSESEQFSYNMIPTEMIVAMHNLRVGIEEALLGLAAFGLSADLKDKVRDVFISKGGEETTDLELLFKNVVEEAGPKGYLPVANVQISSDLNVNIEQYQGTLAFLKEMAGKYHFYDFENVPKAMSGACRKKGEIRSPFASSSNQGECSHLQNPPPQDDTNIDSGELRTFQKMCQELIEDANMIYGQFCAVGSIYRVAVQK